ncbi:hypothetical protein LI87_0112625 [Stenotrophomonas maltophilia]|nr:hypothetical protein LI87_0112625 [Stenotrophomonas maltophilia]
MVAQDADVLVQHHFDQQQVVRRGKPPRRGAEAITGQALGHDTEVPEVDQTAPEMQARGHQHYPDTVALDHSAAVPCVLPGVHAGVLADNVFRRYAQRDQFTRVDVGFCGIVWRSSTSADQHHAGFAGAFAGEVALRCGHQPAVTSQAGPGAVSILIDASAQHDNRRVWMVRCCSAWRHVLCQVQQQLRDGRARAGQDGQWRYGEHDAAAHVSLPNQNRARKQQKECQGEHDEPQDNLKEIRWRYAIVASMLDAMDLKRMSLPVRCAAIVGAVLLAVAVGHLFGSTFPQLFLQIHQRMQ